MLPRSATDAEQVPAKAPRSTARRRRPRADALRNRRAIVTAAAQLVAAEGANVSLEAVARQAGVGSATLHRNFSTRRQLLGAVFEQEIAELDSTASELSRRHAPVEALRAWLARLAAHLTATPGLASVLSTEPPSDARSSSGYERLESTAARLVARARADGTLSDQVTATDLVRLVHAVAVASATSPDTRAATDRLLQLALNGILTSP